MQSFLDKFFIHADSFLIFFFRMTGYSFVDYLIGTTILAFLCVIFGELSISFAIRFNKRYLDAMSSEISQKEMLSMEAYRVGDKAGYKALNKDATDAWGKQFFTMAAYSAGILWPLPFALAWMQTRFADVEFALAFPLSLIFGKSVGYAFTFIPLYILCRILFKYLRPHLPYLKGVQQLLKKQDIKDTR
jgi:hypothetical protein